MRVLIIEDDQRLTRLIASVLDDEQFAYDIAHEGNQGLELALMGIHDVIIVDWMLPGRDGPSICRAIRAAHLPIGVLMLTARGQVEDRVTGLDSGADDYLMKPFAFDELLARIRALSRRFSVSAVNATELRVGRLVMDLSSHTLRRADQAIELSKTEWDLLEMLMRHAGQSLSRQQILDYVWSYENNVKPEIVDVYISYLRQKLSIPHLPDPIRTVRSIGYSLEPQHA